MYNEVIKTSDGRVKGKRLLNASTWICQRPVAGIDDGRTVCGCDNMFARKTCSLCGAERPK